MYKYSSLAMAADDLVYIGLLIFSIPFGHLIKVTDGHQRKQFISFAVGLCIVVIVSGLHTAHSLLTVFVNVAIVKLLSPRYKYLSLSPIMFFICNIFWAFFLFACMCVLLLQS